MNPDANDKMCVASGRCRSPRHRRGSVYVVVLGTAMIVTIIGLSSLLVTRLEYRAGESTVNFAEARLYALSATDMLLLAIQKKGPGWEIVPPGKKGPVLLASGKIGNGSYAAEGVSVDDGDSDPQNDPIWLIGTGFAGRARYKLQVQLDGNGTPLPGTWRQITD